MNEFQREEFHPHKTYVARLPSLYCAMKLYIETSLTVLNRITNSDQMGDP
jgi:hypothetical protein